MRILLAEPPISPFDVPTGLLGLPEPLALELIAAEVEPHHDVEILDMRLGRELQPKLETFEPDVVATGTVAATMHLGKEILEQAKEFNPQILTIVGGHHATMMPNDFDEKYVDIIVVGEADFTFAEIIRRYEKKQYLGSIRGLYLKKDGTRFFTGDYELIDLDEMPIPRRELTAGDRDKYFRGAWRPITSMVSSRGCPFNCKFCSLWIMNKGKYRNRKAELVVDEIAGIKSEYIDFVDDNTLDDLKRSERLTSLLKDRGIKKKYKLYGRPDTVVKSPDLIEKWKDVGLEILLVGLESFRDKELREWGKTNTAEINEKAVHILKRNEVELSAYFVIDPQYDRRDFQKLSEYVERMDLTHPIFTILCPFPGTELFKERYDELITRDYRLFDLFHTVFPTKLPLDEFYEEFAKLYAQAYSFEKYKQIAGSGRFASTDEQFTNMLKVINKIENLADDGVYC